MLRPVLRSKCISLWTKLRIFSSNVMAVLLYGSETWRLTKRIIFKLQTFISRRLRYIMGIWWPRRISNEDLWQCTKQERVEVTIRRRKWGWIGHTLRKPATNITRQSLEWNPQGSRKRGRPKKSWRRTVQKEFENIGLSWEAVKQTAQNRVRSGGPMLRSERRGLSQSYSITTFTIHENMLPGIFIFLVTGKTFPF